MTANMPEYRTLLVTEVCPPGELQRRKVTRIRRALGGAAGPAESY